MSKSVYIYISLIPDLVYANWEYGTSVPLTKTHNIHHYALVDNYPEVATKICYRLNNLASRLSSVAIQNITAQTKSPHYTLHQADDIYRRYELYHFTKAWENKKLCVEDSGISAALAKINKSQKRWYAL